MLAVRGIVLTLRSRIMLLRLLWVLVAIICRISSRLLAERMASKSKKLKFSQTGSKSAPSSSSSSSSTTEQQRQKNVLKLPSRKPLQPKDPTLGLFPCCLCDSLDTSGLLCMHDPLSSKVGRQSCVPKDTDGRAQCCLENFRKWRRRLS